MIKKNKPVTRSHFADIFIVQVYAMVGALVTIVEKTLQLNLIKLPKYPNISKQYLQCYNGW